MAIFNSYVRGMMADDCHGTTHEIIMKSAIKTRHLLSPWPSQRPGVAHAPGAETDAGQGEAACGMAAKLEGAQLPEFHGSFKGFYPLVN